MGVATTYNVGFVFPPAFAMSRCAPHLCSFLVSLFAILYGGVTACASETPDARTRAPIAAKPAAIPHIALLLPSGSDALGIAADAVRQGFEAAAKKVSASALPTRLYPLTDDGRQMIASYRLAIAAGATLVVGPLTRSGVTALAGSDVISVPTLVLNVPERVTRNHPDLYVLSLQVEAEARQVAQLALRDGRRKALIVTESTAFGRRMREAFADEFARGSGHTIGNHAYESNPEALDRFKQAASLGVADMVFLAVDAAGARTLAPYLATLPAYGTAQLNPGTAGAVSYGGIAEVHFVDMPWMIQPDHPAVMVYARSGSREPDDLERLYALGIDAYRISQELLGGKRAIDLDGVTGRLVLGPDRQVQRVLPIALISTGKFTVREDKQP